MKATNTLIPNASKPKFSDAIMGASIQLMISKSVPDEASRARFTGSLLSVVSATPALQDCQPASIVASALRGEGMGLILGHGYHVVPYGKMATFILSYKGYIQLAMATGLYADMDCIDIREGEVKGRDKRTGKPSIDLSVYETDEEREAQKIVGYYAYFELKDGTFRYEYWPIQKLLKHADRYSAAFKLSEYEKMLDGTYGPSEIEKKKQGSPWYDIDGGQIAMCKKTVLRSLLNSGYAPLSNEVRSIIKGDSDDGIVPDIEIPTSAVQVTESASGQEQKAAEEAFFQSEEAEEAPAEKTSAEKPARKQKATQEDAEAPAEAPVEAEIVEEAQTDFFGL